MATRLRRTRTNRSKVRSRVDSADKLVEQISKLLNGTSEDPQSDADKIVRAVDEIRSSLLASRETPRSSAKDAPPMLKEEIKRTTKPKSAMPTLQELIDRVVDNPDAWLSTPNVQLGNREPGKLIGTKEEFKLINLLRAVDLGLF